MKRSALLLLALAAFACSATNEGGISMVTGDSNYDSTDKLRFEIEQTSHPMIFAGDKGRTDVSFRITITNKDTIPITIKRLSLQSLGGGAFRLETSSRKFDRTIAPQAKESFKYWAAAVATDSTVGTHAPLVIRTTVEGVTGEGRIREVFNRRVNDQVTIGIGD